MAQIRGKRKIQKEKVGERKKTFSEMSKERGRKDHIPFKPKKRKEDLEGGSGG